MSIRQAFMNTPVRAKIMGSIFIVIGIYLIISQKENVYLNIGFGAIFIGLFAIIVITEKSIPKKLYDAQLLSNIELIDSFIKSLNLKGNGIYIPAGGNLSKERVFVPVQEEEIYNLPALDDDTVFVTGTTGSSLGVLFVPPGLRLLDLYENETNIKFKDIDIDDLEPNLQIVIHELNLIKELSIEKEGDKIIKLKLTHSEYKNIYENIVSNMNNIYKKSGCPISSSIICAITRALGKKIRIQNVYVKNNEISFKLEIGE